MALSAVDRLAGLPASISPLLGPLLAGLAGAGLGWLVAPAALRLAGGRGWPRKRSAIVSAAAFAVHILLRPLPTIRGDWAATAIGILDLAVLVCLVVIVQIDLTARVIPNRLVLAILAAGLVKMALYPAGSVSQITGFVLIGAVMAVVGVAGRGALGAGDVKLLAAAGMYLGWEGGIPAFLVSFCLAGAAGVYLLLRRPPGGKRKVPFAPFLCAGIWSVMLFGPRGLGIIWRLLAR